MNVQKKITDIKVFHFFHFFAFGSTLLEDSSVLLPRFDAILVDSFVVDVTSCDAKETNGDTFVSRFYNK
jgi:hypothetical protein